MKEADVERVKRSQRDYHLGFKLSVVEQVEKGEFTYKQAQKHYGIQGRSTVLVWLRKHGKLDWNPSYQKSMSKSKETPAQKLKPTCKGPRSPPPRSLNQHVTTICSVQFQFQPSHRWFMQFRAEPQNK